MKNNKFNQYIDNFNKLAVEQQPLADGVKFWTLLDRDNFCDKEHALHIIRNTIKSLNLKPDDLVGMCFSVVMTTSIALIKAGVKHIVTIGNVVIDRKPYFKTSVTSIQEDLRIGYLDDKPAEAHAWITLEDGTVIDITILSSLAYKNNRRPLKLIKSIYVSSENSADIMHIPYFLGPMYIVKTCLDPSELSYIMTGRWLTSMHDLLDSNN